jgi:tRNA threonylcarbamoyladenosine biosynthesis protein TsaE
VYTLLTLRAATAEDTRQIGAHVAALCERGDVIALTGELGAGKTTFVQGAAAALGVTDVVTSPTFLLRRDYVGRLPVTHLDVYRLDALTEVMDLGVDDVFDGPGVAFVEWGDAASPLLPPEHLEIELRLDLDGGAGAVGGSPAAGDDAPVMVEEPRRIVVRPYGNRWKSRTASLAERLQPWHDRDEEH